MVPGYCRCGAMELLSEPHWHCPKCDERRDRVVATQRAPLDEARAIINTAHQGDDTNHGISHVWHERRRDWLRRCEEAGQ